jgi:hypothetical protein
MHQQQSLPDLQLEYSELALEEEHLGVNRYLDESLRALHYR